MHNDCKKVISASDFTINGLGKLNGSSDVVENVATPSIDMIRGDICHKRLVKLPIQAGQMAINKGADTLVVAGSFIHEKLLPWLKRQPEFVTTYTSGGVEYVVFSLVD